MNYSIITRLSVLFLIVGFIFSCSTTQPSVNINQLMEQNQYEQALEEINNQITSGNATADLYLTKADILARMGMNKALMDRNESYRSSLQSISKADSIGLSPEQERRIDEIKEEVFNFEQTQGLKTFQNSTDNSGYTNAEQHFEYALAFNEGDVITYRNLAIAQFEQGKINEAISTLQNAEEILQVVPYEIYENLGYLYLEKGNADKAIEYYEKANEDVMNNLNLAFGLANAYISAGNHEASTRILEELVEQYPNNAQLRNVYGTQLYMITVGIMNDLENAYRNNNSDITEQLLFEAEGMGEEAETQLVEAFKRDTSNVEYVESLAVFYNNMAHKYLMLTNIAPDENLERIRAKTQTLLDFAIEYYSKLKDDFPQNSDYSKKLDTLRSLKQNKFT